MDQWVIDRLQSGDVAIAYYGSEKGAFHWATWNGQSWIDESFSKGNKSTRVSSLRLYIILNFRLQYL